MRNDLGGALDIDFVAGRFDFRRTLVWPTSVLPSAAIGQPWSDLNYRGS